jgi:hypothetical protein
MGEMVYALLGLIAAVAFIILIATPGGMEAGEIAIGEGALRMIISGGICGVIMWVLSK